MSKEESLSITVKLDGTNYNHWYFLMRSFLKGKGMWKYINGKETVPKARSDPEEVWEVNNHKILTWIGSIVINSISMQLTGFEIAKEAWDFLEKRYTQINFVQRYKLEQDIRVIKQQHEQSITDFHPEMSVIWNQLALMEPRWTMDIELWEKYMEETQLIQLLMALREEFESVRASILHRSPLPTVEVALAELITEETRKKIKTEGPSVLAVPIKSGYNSNSNVQKYSGSTYNREIPYCYNCKKSGHLNKNCTLPIKENAHNTYRNSAPRAPSFCVYCRKNGHIIQNCTSPSSFNMKEKRRIRELASSHVAGAMSEQSREPFQHSQINLAEVQEMIRQALSVNKDSNLPGATAMPTFRGILTTQWFLDSGASNHMTYNLSLFEEKWPITTPNSDISNDF